MRNFTAILLGALGGIGASVICGLVYLNVLLEPGPAFYPFAALVFLGGPILGGTVAALRAEHKLKAFLASSATVFGVMFFLFFVTYAALPQLSRESVQLPEVCDGFDGSLDPPSELLNTLPEGGRGILLTENAESAAVATIDGSEAPFSSTMYLVRKRDNHVLTTMQFDNDVVTVSMDEGTVYVFNDKLGYLIDERTGAFEENFLLIDNYGGLSETDRPIISRVSSGNWYLETTGVISSWNVDGTVKSRPHLTFSGIARGCHISGTSRDVTRL